MDLCYPIILPSSQFPILTLSHPCSSIWVIELHNGSDNCLTANFILNAILPALDHVERAWRNSWRTKRENVQDAGKGALVIVGRLSQDKFFSPGVTSREVIAEASFWSNVFYPLMWRLLTFPMPTVAAVNGHAFGAGWLLAAWCDYRVMFSGKCWASMPEIFMDLGSDFPHALIVFLRTKFSNVVQLRKLTLEGHRWTPQELLTAGMVDDIVEGGSERILKRALALAEKWSSNAKTGIYGPIKKQIYHEVLEAIRLDICLISTAEDNEVVQREIFARARL